MNISRLFWTISSLKPVQICYQLRYRLLGYKKVKLKTCSSIKEEMDVSIKELDEDDACILRFKVDELLENHIWILNESIDWQHGKWNYPDKTHLWDFNLHYFEYGVALAAAYKKSCNEAYYKKLTELYKDWHDTCFDTVAGDAWHPYTISLRLKNLLIIYGILHNKKEDWITLVKQDMYDQYRFLAANTEKNLLGNHYFENLTTLYLCSAFFNDESGLTRYNNLLFREIKEQILSDGMHFERSFMYHNLILEDLLRIYKAADKLCQRMLKDTVTSMAGCVSSFETDNRLPAFNDAGANVAKSKTQLLQAVYTLTKQAPADRVALQSAGYYRFEHEKWKLIADAGEYAPRYISGHGHCDMLSIELFHNGEPILVNSGTYQYQTELRGYFRSTKAHNTLQIDGIEQSEIWGEHRTGRRARIFSSKLMDNALLAIMKDYRGNRLKRQINVSYEIQIMDSASSQFTSYWHIHPSNKVSMPTDDQIKIITPIGTTILMKSEGGAFVDISEECHYSENFGEIRELPSYKTKAGKIKILAI